MPGDSSLPTDPGNMSLYMVDTQAHVETATIDFGSKDDTVGDWHLEDQVPSMAVDDTHVPIVMLDTSNTLSGDIEDV